MTLAEMTLEDKAIVLVTTVKEIDQYGIRKADGSITFPEFLWTNLRNIIMQTEVSNAQTPVR